MKSIKLMFLGAIFLLAAIWCAIMDGGTSSYLAGASIVLAPIGVLIFFVGFFRKEK